MSAPVLVAPDKFKGTLSAAEVAAAVVRGLRAAGREAVELLVADGGSISMSELLEIANKWTSCRKRPAGVPKQIAWTHVYDLVQSDRRPRSRRPRVSASSSSPKKPLPEEIVQLVRRQIAAERTGTTPQIASRSRRRRKRKKSQP